MTDQLRAGLYDANRVTLATIPDRQIRQEEFIEQFAHRGVIICGNRAIKLHRRLRNEIEYRRRIYRYTQRFIGGGVDLRSRQAAKIREAVAQAAANRHHGLDFAHTVLEADQVRATIRETFEHVGVELRVGAVIDDHAHVLHRLAHLFDVRGDSVL